jgi:acyl carrier protein
MNQQVVECLYLAIDDINRDRGDKPPLEKSLDTPIYGTASDLDSLGLINFVVAAEEEVERSFDVPIMLGDDRALSAEPSPFQSIGTLAAYVESLLEEQLPAPELGTR